MLTQSATFQKQKQKSGGWLIPPLKQNVGQPLQVTVPPQPAAAPAAGIGTQHHKVYSCCLQCWSVVSAALMARVEYKGYWPVILQGDIHHSTKHTILHTLCSTDTHTPRSKAAPSE